jgi:hypothetical protein
MVKRAAIQDKLAPKVSEVDTPKPKKARAKRKPNAHTELVNATCDFLLDQGYFVWQNKSMGTFNPYRKHFLKVGYSHGRIKGVPDILGVLPDGRLLAIEIKTGTGRLNPEQRDFIKKAEFRGAIAFMARSLEDVVKTFSRHLLPIKLVQTLSKPLEISPLN